MDNKVGNTRDKLQLWEIEILIDKVIRITILNMFRVIAIYHEALNHSLKAFNQLFFRDSIKKFMPISGLEAFPTRMLFELKN